jgi:hypothetical protein
VTAGLIEKILNRCQTINHIDREVHGMATVGFMGPYLTYGELAPGKKELMSFGPSDGFAVAAHGAQSGLADDRCRCP